MDTSSDQPDTTPTDAALAEDAPEDAQPTSGLSRRVFLSRAALAAGGAAIVSHMIGLGSAAAQEVPSGNVPQWAMVIDLSRCDGCKECTKACQDTHFTGDQEWIKVFEVADEGGGTYFLPRPCMQCENAPCLNVCPVGATFRNENGTVLINHETCIGCRFCIAACPYGARSFNWGEPENPPGASLARYTPEFPVPHRKGTPDKCMFCAHDAEVGKLPACVTACPMSAIWFGDLVKDIATNGLETVKLSWLLSDRNAFRLKEELGTRPRVWYLPGNAQQSEVVIPV